jgi:4-hydroxy-tetrahydrodipicolinate synthase
MNRRLLFRGTGTALVTPFKKDGSVDESTLRDLIERQIRGKIDALVPVGSTGEGATLSPEEQADVIAIVVDQVRGRIPVIAGASSNSTSAAIALARRAKASGAEVILSAAPYYNKPTQEGIIEHFSHIADAVEIPIVIYNVPGRTASNIEAATTLKLAREIPFIIGVKEASGNFAQISEIIRNRPKGFGVWSGDDALALPLIALGADGVISVVANEVPKMFSEMARLALKGKTEQARMLHFKLLDLMTANFMESNPIPVKAALTMMGLMDDTVRLPLTPISSHARTRLQSILKQLKLL